MKKTVVILQHNGGRLANQLWLFVSVYAYCLEKGYKIDNPSFYEYAFFFDIKSRSFFINLFFYKLYGFLKYFSPRSLRLHFFNLVNKFYQRYVDKVEHLHKTDVVYAIDGENPVVHYLPPSKDVDDKINKFDINNNQEEIYLYGWLFRNPVGIKKYRTKIVDYLKPKTMAKISDFIFSQRAKFKHLVGVHIRQGDFREFFGGKFYLSSKEVVSVLCQYMKNFGKSSSETVFMI
ncbi:hypothetical protein HZA75_03285, partial [Candidatus Roizmanbacteria bacterium]|nr:hypothetical protein [Candidatus Roizmanbacteria bacterium]